MSDFKYILAGGDGEDYASNVASKVGFLKDKYCVVVGSLFTISRSIVLYKLVCKSRAAYYPSILRSSGIDRVLASSQTNSIDAECLFDLKEASTLLKATEQYLASTSCSFGRIHFAGLSLRNKDSSLGTGIAFSNPVASIGVVTEDGYKTGTVFPVLPHTLRVIPALSFLMYRNHSVSAVKTRGLSTSFSPLNRHLPPPLGKEDRCPFFNGELDERIPPGYLMHGADR